MVSLSASYADEFPLISKALVAAVVLAAPVGAQTPADTVSKAILPIALPKGPGSDLTVYLLTFEWGDVVWERFALDAGDI